MRPYAERLAEAKALYAQPAGDDLPNQKFPRGTRVLVAEHMLVSMSYFPTDFQAIIDYCYGQKYGDDDIDSYSLVILDGEGIPSSSIAWYQEDQLTLIDDNIAHGIKLIEGYYKNNEE